MAWYQLESKDSSELDKLAEEYKLHPVHVEECRTHEGRIKVDLMPDYLFVTLKPLHIVDGEIAESPLHAFVGRDFLHYGQRPRVPARARGDWNAPGGPDRIPLRRKSFI